MRIAPVVMVPIALLVAPACGEREPATTGDTTSTSAATGTAAVTTTTIDDGVAPPGVAVSEVCDLLDAALRTVGVVLAEAPAQDMVAAGSATDLSECDWRGGEDGSVSLSVVNDVDSAAFEQQVADISMGDPITVDGLGEMAVYSEYAPTAAEVEEFGDDLATPNNVVIVYAGRRMITLLGQSPSIVDESSLTALAREVVTRLR